MNTVYFIGLDIHKKSITFVIKTHSGQLIRRGSVEATRPALTAWANQINHPWIGALEATMFSGWVYDLLKPYAADAAAFGDEYFTEKLETKAGWNRPSCDEDWFRGFAQEIADFVHAIRDGREPGAGIDLAVDTVNVIYSAYLSAEEGRSVDLE